MARSIHWLAALRLSAAFKPSFFTFGALSIGALYLGGRAHLWLRLLVSLFATPTFFVVKLYLEDWDRQHRARAAGAKLPPVVPYKWPGGIDIIMAIGKAGAVCIVRSASHISTKGGVDLSWRRTVVLRRTRPCTCVAAVHVVREQGIVTLLWQNAIY